MQAETSVVIFFGWSHEIYVLLELQHNIDNRDLVSFDATGVLSPLGFCILSQVAIAKVILFVDFPQIAQAGSRQFSMYPTSCCSVETRWLSRVQRFTIAELDVVRLTIVRLTIVRLTTVRIAEHVV